MRACITSLQPFVFQPSLWCQSFGWSLTPFIHIVRGVRGGVRAESCCGSGVRGNAYRSYNSYRGVYTCVRVRICEYIYVSLVRGVRVIKYTNEIKDLTSYNSSYSLLQRCKGMAVSRGQSVFGAVSAIKYRGDIDD